MESYIERSYGLAEANEIPHRRFGGWKRVVVGTGIALGLVVCCSLVVRDASQRVEDLSIGVVDQSAMRKAAKLALEDQFKAEDRNLEAQLGVLAHKTGFADSGLSALGMGDDSDSRRWSKESAKRRIERKYRHHDGLFSDDSRGDPTSALLQLDSSNPQLATSRQDTASADGSVFPILLQTDTSNSAVHVPWADSIQNWAERMSAAGLSPNSPHRSSIAPGDHTAEALSQPPNIQLAEAPSMRHPSRAGIKLGKERGVSGLYGIGGVGPGEEEENAKDWVIAMHVDPNCKEALKDLADGSIGALLTRGLNNSNCLPYKKKNPLMWPYGPPGEAWKELEDAVKRYERGEGGRRDVKERSTAGETPREMEAGLPKTAALHPEMAAREEGPEKEVRVLGEELRRVKEEVLAARKGEEEQRELKEEAEEDDRAEERKARREEEAKARAEDEEEREEREARALRGAEEAGVRMVQRVRKEVVELGEGEAKLLRAREMMSPERGEELSGVRREERSEPGGGGRSRAASGAEEEEEEEEEELKGQVARDARALEELRQAFERGTEVKGKWLVPWTSALARAARAALPTGSAPPAAEEARP